MKEPIKIVQFGRCHYLVTDADKTAIFEITIHSTQEEIAEINNETIHTIVARILKEHRKGGADK